MTLAMYTPHFRNILFEKVFEEKTKGGIYLPTEGMKLVDYSDVFNGEKVQYDGSKDRKSINKVVKVGPDCTSTEPGDILVLSQGIQGQEIEIEGKSYYTVMEMQTVGSFREPVKQSIEDFLNSKIEESVSI